MSSLFERNKEVRGDISKPLRTHLTTLRVVCVIAREALHTAVSRERHPRRSSPNARNLPKLIRIRIALYQKVYSTPSSLCYLKVVGDRPGAAEHAAKPYVDRVVQEIRATAAVLDRSHRRTVSPADRPPHSSEESDVRDSKGEHKVVNTLFFGGGTPSLCPPELVGLLIDTVQDCLGIASGAEISIEMDPGTFDEVWM